MGLQNPGLPSSQIPAGEDHVMRSIKDIERYLRELSAQVNALRPGSVVTSLLADSAVTAPKIGSAAVTAPAIGTGAVTAPALGAGSVTFAALAAPVVPAAVNLTTTAFAPTATWAEVAGLDLTVPADCTRLLADATARVYAINNSAGADDLNARVSLGAVDGQAFLTPLAISGYGTISAGLAVLASGLTPGATVRLKASAKTTTGTWTTDAANTAGLTASLTWLR
jgi:hypothetical protein